LRHWDGGVVWLVGIIVGRFVVELGEQKSASEASV